jgi:protein transport protein SEC23
MEQLNEAEEKDNVRFSWNIFPSTSVESKKLICPLGCLYTPLRKGSNPTRVKYGPITCTTCKNVISPFCDVEFSGVKSWSCCFCGNRNQFPSNYSGISQTQLPAELHPFSTSIEYTIQPSNYKPAFLFVIDTTVKATSLNSIKKALSEVIQTLPKHCNVGFITVGSMVHVYELGFKHFPKTYMFDGKKDVKPEQVQRYLNIGVLGSSGKVVATSNNNIVVPIAGNEEHILSIIDSIHMDPLPPKPNYRPIFSSGTALSVAISVLQYTFPHSGARVLLLSGTACTQGPGLVVGQELSEPIRGYSQLNKEMAVHVHSATKFYDALTNRATLHSIAIDIFAASLDQIGLLEMKSLPRSTGGVIIQSEDFNHEIFQKSFRKFFQMDEHGVLKMGFVCSFEVSVTEEVSICGAIGHITSGYRKNKQVSDTELGIGSTNLWNSAAIDQGTTIAYYFDIKNPKDKIIPQGKNAMIQFRTVYSDSNGGKFLKVTTVAHSFIDTDISGPFSLLPGFDQEAAAALVSRLSLYKSENEDMDIISYTDRHLIQFAKRYASYQPNVISSFNLSDEIALYPEFIFHFRRGPLVSVFGSSPDEVVFRRYHLYRENTANILIMLQPSLESYTFNSSDPEPVLLSSTSIGDQKILVLDTFFHVVIFSGKVIASWRKAKYHEKEEYENFKELLEVPIEDVQDVLNDRFPTPLFVQCDEGSSQARYLLSVVDPSPPSYSGSSFVINTDDASLMTFMEHLKKYVVNSQ